MSDSLLNAVKIFVVVSAVVIVIGTATLIALLVKRGGGVPAAQVVAPAEPVVVPLPAGAEVIQMSVAGSQLHLLTRVPGEGQMVIVLDMATGERKRYLRLQPESP